VAAVVIVEMEEAAEGGCSFLLGVIGPEVGPLLEQGAVEAFNFAVGLWPVGPSEAMIDVAQDFGEELASVAAAVVGEDLADGDAVLYEPGVGTAPEPCRGLFAFVDEDLGVGETAVVVDG